METVDVAIHAHAEETTTKTPKSQDPEEIVGQSPEEPQHPPQPPSPPTSESEKSHDQADPPPGAEGEEEDDDIISSLPDAVLGEIIFLLPTKAGARTQVLSSRWRHVWRSSPLNIDHIGLSAHGNALVALISRIIAGHQGAVRRLCVPERYLYQSTSDVRAWLQSPALEYLDVLEFYSPPLPTFRYSKSNTLPRLRRQLIGK
ncbi:hypothetical protein EJB05_56261, partial [Eragrostis curvula]